MLRKVHADGTNTTTKANPASTAGDVAPACATRVADEATPSCSNILAPVEPFICWTYGTRVKSREQCYGHGKYIETECEIWSHCGNACDLVSNDTT